MTSETIQDRPEIGKSTTFDGVTTNYHDIGSGDPILLVHGSGPGVTSWANSAAAPRPAI